MFFSHIKKCALVMFLCTSCTLTQETTFEHVMSQRHYSGAKLYGDYLPFYCGSDSKFDYYTVCASFPTRHFKVRTTPQLFYPAPVPFRGWLMCDRYYFSMYRGRIMLKSIDQHNQLQHYRNLPEVDLSHTSVRQELEAMNEWCRRNWGSERLRIPDAKSGNSQPEWRYLEESTNYPYTPGQVDFFRYSDPRF